MEQYIKSLEKLIAEIRTDQKNDLTRNDIPIEIAKTIQRRDRVIFVIEDLIEHIREI